MINSDKLASARHSLWLGLLAFVFSLSAWVLDTKTAEAIPAFARKYDMTCNACHTRQPRLNIFGQRFLENGYQLPGTEDGGSTMKSLFGGPLNGVTLDEISNYFAVRLRADIQKPSFSSDTTPMANQGVDDDVDIVFPRTINLFFAGTATKNVSFFFEAEYDTQEDGESSLGFERTMLIFSNIGGHQVANIKIGQFDPSSFFSFPTHRQQLNPIKAEADANQFPPPIGRIPLLPLAFASKMFGLTTGPNNGSDDLSILPYEPYLFNAPVQKGVSVHGRPFGPNLLYQVGVTQNDTAEDKSETRWDPYVMLRYDMLNSDYSALQFSGFYYKADKAARGSLTPGGNLIYSNNSLDWKRYGIGARWQYKYFDLYGTVVWDEIDTPDFGNAMINTSEWETDAMGISVELDYLYSKKLMLGIRYDMMETGGLSKLPMVLRTPGDPDLNQDSSFLAFIAKYYMRPNIGLYARYHYNLEDSVNLPANVGGGEESPVSNLESMFTIGVDMAF